MWQKIRSRYNVKFVAGAALLLALALLLAEGVLHRARLATAAAPAAPLATHTCTPIRVGVFASPSGRIHVQCSNVYVAPGPKNIYWFAVSNSDSATASRFLSVFTTAVVSGKQVYLWFDESDESGAAWGCGAADCRTATGALLLW